jgi:hypothetical protein
MPARSTWHSPIARVPSLLRARYGRIPRPEAEGPAPLRARGDRQRLAYRGVRWTATARAVLARASRNRSWTDRQDRPLVLLRELSEGQLRRCSSSRHSVLDGDRETRQGHADGGDGAHRGFVLRGCIRKAEGLSQSRAHSRPCGRPFSEARTGRIPSIGFTRRTGPDSLANSCTQASRKAECRVSDKRDGLYRRETNHASRQCPRAPRCADQ